MLFWLDIVLYWNGVLARLCISSDVVREKVVKVFRKVRGVVQLVFCVSKRLRTKKFRYLVRLFG